ncbi:MAG: 2-oxoacid:acceptor oxidoreductase family protein [bacterium]
MAEMIEVRWHARAGQGAKTASYLLAEAAMDDGKYIQAFPEYGAERMGAPMRAFDRISDRPIRLHTNVQNPNVVLVLDPTLLAVENVLDGVPEDGVLIVNTPDPPYELRRRLKIEGRKIYTVDANRISQETIGQVRPNTPIMGALAKATNLVTVDSAKRLIKKKFEGKISPKALEGNLKAVERAYEEVKVG